MRGRSQAGVTLIELLISVTLLSLLTGGILTAMHVGMKAMERSTSRPVSAPTGWRAAGAMTPKALAEAAAGFAGAASGGGTSMLDQSGEGGSLGMRLSSTNRSSSPA